MKKKILLITFSADEKFLLFIFIDIHDRDRVFSSPALLTSSFTNYCLNFFQTNVKEEIWITCCAVYLIKIKYFSFLFWFGLHHQYNHQRSKSIASICAETQHKYSLGKFLQWKWICRRRWDELFFHAIANTRQRWLLVIRKPTRLARFDVCLPSVALQKIKHVSNQTIINSCDFGFEHLSPMSPSKAGKSEVDISPFPVSLC